MEMKAEPAQVLMSDVLRGQVPELEGEQRQIEELQAKHVLVVAEKATAVKTEGLVGILRGVLLGPEPEIEFRCDLKEALAILKANQLSFVKFELHYGDDVIVPIPGPFNVKAARIDEISPTDELCTLGLHLVRQQR